MGNFVEAKMPKVFINGEEFVDLRDTEINMNSPTPLIPVMVFDVYDNNGFVTKVGILV